MSDLKNQTDEFEPKSKKTKDFWLFLIFIDIIALAFFGFMIYQALSVKFSVPQPVKDPVVKEVTQEPVKQQPKTPAAPQAQQPKKEEPQPLPTEIQVPAQVPVEPVIKPDPQAEEKISPAPEEKKQSVVIENTKSTKTRKVTFKYFGEANKVQIVSGFTMAKPQTLKKVKGVWEGSFIIYPGEYKYMFIVDGINKLDPHAPEKDGRSLLVVK